MPDRPGHMLEISDALGRDVDKARAGKLKGALPAEAFMTDAALEQVARQSQQRAAPVHAESMVPISRAEAAARTTFTRDGESVPVVPAMKRVIPAPFQRPRVNGGRHGKAWHVLPAAEILEGDLVPDVGRVLQAEARTLYATRENVAAQDEALRPLIAGPGNVLAVPAGELEDYVAVGLVMLVQGAGGVIRAFRESDQVRVFRKAPGEDDGPSPHA